MSSDWTHLAAPTLFDQDHFAWRKKVKTHSNLAESVMTWSDISDFTRNAYALMCDLGNTYAFLASRNRLPATLPDECTPDGFYRAAVMSRDRQVGVWRDELDIPSFEELAPFSKFIYGRITDRLREIVEPDDDGLDFDDGLEDGLWKI